MNPILEFKKVTKQFQHTKALNEVSFSMKKNSCVCLVGNNGSGKSTTAKLLAQLILPSSGEILFNNVAIKKQSEYKKQIGFLLDEPHHIEEFSAREYLQFVAKFQKVTAEQTKERLKNLFDFFDLEDSRMKIKEHSSGNEMKVRLAAALIHNPELLVLDEPFVNLDMQTTSMLIEKLKKIKARKSILMTTHQLAINLELCETFVVMDKGSVIGIYEKSDFENEEQLKETITNLLIKEDTDDTINWL